jgi:hypothetical protein
MQRSDGRPVSAGLPDLVYIIGPGDDHDEFRHSLRSVAKNFPHRKVFVAGQVPAFLTGIEGISLAPDSDKYTNMRQSLTAALNHPDIGETFAFMNDDFFVMKPVPQPAPVFHLGPIGEYLAHLASIGKSENDWMRSMRETLEWVGGDPLCYETHIPLVFNTEALRAILGAFPHDRTFTPTGVYQAARAGLEGVLGTDSKVSTGSPDPDSIYLSSADWSWRKCATGDLVRRTFPQRCEYEI